MPFFHNLPSNRMHTSVSLVFIIDLLLESTISTTVIVLVYNLRQLFQTTPLKWNDFPRPCRFKTLQLTFQPRYPLKNKRLEGN